LSVLVGTALDFLLIPYCQREYGNGGIGVVVSFGLSEFVVFAGALVILLRRHALEAATALDAARALGAAAVTVLLLHLVPPLPLTLGIPLCVGAFVGVSLLFLLLALRDLILLWNIVRREDLDRAGAAGPNP
jgi:hypothetical protein